MALSMRWYKQLELNRLNLLRLQRTIRTGKTSCFLRQIEPQVLKDRSLVSLGLIQPTLHHTEACSPSCLMYL